MFGLDRITTDPNIMGGQAGIRGLRISVSLIVNLVTNGLTVAQIIDEYPDLEPEDIWQAVQYASWAVDDEVLPPLGTSAIIATLPQERVAEVYDFARFLRTQVTPPSPIAEDTTDDWLYDSEEQLQAEDAVWDGFYARHREKLSALRAAARAEITAGTTEPVLGHHTTGSLADSWESCDE